MICRQCEHPKELGLHTCGRDRAAQDMAAMAQQHVWQGLQGNAAPPPASIVDELRQRAAKLRRRMIEAQRDQKELETIERMLQAVES